MLPLFSQVLDGVEAAHLQDVVHRDLKPENILYDYDSRTLAIADFGIADSPRNFLLRWLRQHPHRGSRIFSTQPLSRRNLGQAVGRSQTYMHWG